MSKYLSVIILLFAVGCGGGSSGSSGNNSAAASKSLFSNWTSTTSTNAMNLSGANFGTNSIFFLFASGSECSCTLNILGAQSSGTWVLSSCIYVPGSGPSDPGCGVEDGSGTYSLPSTTLSLCRTGQPCGTFN